MRGRGMTIIVAAFTICYVLLVAGIVVYLKREDNNYLRTVKAIQDLDVASKDHKHHVDNMIQTLFKTVDINTTQCTRDIYDTRLSLDKKLLEVQASTEALTKHHKYLQGHVEALRKEQSRLLKKIKLRKKKLLKNEIQGPAPAKAKH